MNKVKFSDLNFPKQLKSIPNPPKQLYYEGKWSDSIFKKTLAIVGSRSMTHYGQQTIDMIIPDLVSQGVTIISGFMYGVDTAVHEKCLEFRGKTIAVFASGLDIIYPSENKKLFQQIIKNNGLVISEYPLGTKPQLWTYPQRNRIVSGLSNLGVLVIEAGEKSGSLITAQLAIKQKRPVFAMPGQITSSVCLGTNQLIKDGKAKMVTCANDILKTSKKTKIDGAQAPTSAVETKIIKLIGTEPLTIDEIAKKINKNVIKTSQILTKMSLKKTIEERRGKYYLIFNIGEKSIYLY